MCFVWIQIGRSTKGRFESRAHKSQQMHEYQLCEIRFPSFMRSIQNGHNGHWLCCPKKGGCIPRFSIGKKLCWCPLPLESLARKAKKRSWFFATITKFFSYWLLEHVVLVVQRTIECIRYHKEMYPDLTLHVVKSISAGVLKSPFRNGLQFPHKQATI